MCCKLMYAQIHMIHITCKLIDVHARDPLECGDVETLNMSLLQYYFGSVSRDKTNITF